jgi:hypothetical protein
MWAGLTFFYCHPSSGIGLVKVSAFLHDSIKAKDWSINNNNFQGFNNYFHDV